MSQSTDNIQQAYDRWAEIYDSNDNPTRDLNYQAIRNANLALPGQTVLEIGCGNGLNTTFLARHAQKVVAVDFSDQMLAKARQRVQSETVDFVTADITEPWRFKESSFDLVVGNLVLEHIDDLSQVYAEAYRVLRPGGQYYIAELHPYKQLRQSQAKFEDQQTGEEVLVEAYTHSTSEYVNTALAAGFLVDSMREHQKADEPVPRLLSLLFRKNSQKK